LTDSDSSVVVVNSVDDERNINAEEFVDVYDNNDDDDHEREVEIPQIPAVHESESVENLKLQVELAKVELEKLKLQAKIGNTHVKPNQLLIIA
jgi:hypothetical protein